MAALAREIPVDFGSVFSELVPERQTEELIDLRARLIQSTRQFTEKELRILIGLVDVLERSRD